MSPKQNKKSLIILSSVMLAGCAASAVATVACHQFGSSDRIAIRAAILALPDDNALHPVIRDYERVCAQLK